MAVLSGARYIVSEATAPSSISSTGTRKIHCQSRSKVSTTSVEVTNASTEAMPAANV